MRWIVNLLRRLIGWGSRTTRASGSRIELPGDYPGRTLEELNESRGYNKQTIRALGPDVTSDGRTSVEATFDILEENGTLRSVNYIEIRRCSCGAVLAYKNAALKGLCHMCGRSLCDQEGCAYRCGLCGRLVCREHAVVKGDKVYCRACRGRALWLKFWSLWK